MGHGIGVGALYRRELAGELHVAWPGVGEDEVLDTLKGGIEDIFGECAWYNGPAKHGALRRECATEAVSGPIIPAIASHE